MKSLKSFSNGKDEINSHSFKSTKFKKNNQITLYFRYCAVNINISRQASSACGKKFDDLQYRWCGGVLFNRKNATAIASSHGLTVIIIIAPSNHRYCAITPPSSHPKPRSNYSAIVYYVTIFGFQFTVLHVNI